MKDATKVDFKYEFQSLARAVSQITKFEDLWKSVKEDLLASSDTTYHWIGLGNHLQSRTKYLRQTVVFM